MEAYPAPSLHPTTPQNAGNVSPEKCNSYSLIHVITLICVYLICNVSWNISCYSNSRSINLYYYATAIICFIGYSSYDSISNNDRKNGLFSLIRSCTVDDENTLQYNTKSLCRVEHTEYRTPTVSDYMRSGTDIPISFDFYYIFVS